MADLVVAAGVLQKQLVKLDGAAEKGLRRGVAVIQREECVFVAPIDNAVLVVFRQPERQFALGGGVGEGDFAHIAGDKGFAVVQRADACADFVEIGGVVGRGNGAGNHINIARFGEPAVFAVVKPDIPFVPHACVVFGLQPPHHGEALPVVCACGADLDGAEILQ